MRSSKWFIPAIVIGVLVVLGMILAGAYNGLVAQRETVTKSWSDVETQYQRRADLVDNLVATVKGSAEFEQSTLTQVTDARSKVGSIQIDPSNAQQMENFQEAQGEMSSALSRLIAVSENYPDLKTTAAFQDLMVQLEGTENRVAVARSDYGEAARPYNTRLQTFPTNILAGLFGFTKFEYFDAEAGAEDAPQVDFGTSATQAQE